MEGSMKFKVGNKIYNLAALLSNDEEWRIRFTDAEGLVLTAPEEIDELNGHGDPTGTRVVVWNDVLTLATGEDARKLWAALTRVLVAEKVCLDVDEFLEHVEEHDLAVETGRNELRERQRIARLESEERLAETSGLSLAAIRAKQQRGWPSPVQIVEMPSAGPFGRNN
jgi:hypothetical protein